MAVHEDLISSTAVTAAVALAEYSSFYDAVSEISSLPEGQRADRLRELGETVREQALSLFLLARSICEYGDNLQVLPEDDPRMVLPLLQEIGESYALLSLVQDSDEFQLGLLLSPERLEIILDDRVADFLSRWGEKEAISILEDRKKLYGSQD